MNSLCCAISTLLVQYWKRSLAEFWSCHCLVWRSSDALTWRTGSALGRSCGSSSTSTGPALSVSSWSSGASTLGTISVLDVVRTFDALFVSTSPALSFVWWFTQTNYQAVPSKSISSSWAAPALGEAWWTWVCTVCWVALGASQCLSLCHCWSGARRWVCTLSWWPGSRLLPRWSLWQWFPQLSQYGVIWWNTLFSHPWRHCCEHLPCCFRLFLLLWRCCCPCWIC